VTTEQSRPAAASGSAALTWTLILPCAAPLPAPPARRPKWLLTAPNGELFVRTAADSVPGQQVGDIVVAFLREAEEAYHCTEAIRRAFDDRVRCVVLDERTAGPAETVRQVIDRAGLSGPIAVKDSDSFLGLGALPDTSFLAVSDIRGRQRLSSPGRKSYVRLNEQGMVADVVEKNIVSNLISCGLYGFLDPAVFAAEFDRLVRQVGHRRLFVSHVLSSAVLHGEVFLPVHATDFIDLETAEDLEDYRLDYATIVIDVDGVIFRNQSRFFPPYWGDPVEPIQENIDHARALQARGAQLVFMTARPEMYRAVTAAALENAGLRAHALVMGCNHSARFLVNDFAQSNPYPSALAVNIERNRPTLSSLLLPGRASQDRDL
jgi:hypothetical protein